MMDLSTRFLPLFGLSLITVFAVSCAQPGAGDGVLPMSPSSLSVGQSAAALGPGASYDASGPWSFVLTDVHGNVDDTFETNVSQDANGNLSFLNEHGFLITLERLGTGVIITYRQSQVVPPEGGGDCDIRIQGTARLDTRTNTLTGNLFLRELGCSHQHHGPLFYTGTKLS
jgi:hypothetical protein